jgi:putative heme-binding domain-containing protein
MPPLTHLGPAAPCGLTRLESSGLGSDHAQNLLACLFNMHKLTRHVVRTEGAGLRTEDSDFLVSENIDFHPTDVLEDADGSVLVVDTGGWYKICCPTSHLYKPDVLGGIYRVRRTGAPAVVDPRGLKLAWTDISVDELAERLADERFAVRRRAMDELAVRGGDAVRVLAPLLTSQTAPATRLAAVWTLGRIESSAARAAGYPALRDGDPDVRQAAAHICGLWRDLPAVPHLLQLLGDAPAATRRVAAEALGRTGQSVAVPALLQAAASGPADRFLEHSLIYALIEIGDADATRAGLSAAAPATRRAALIALDQMPGGGLSADKVAALLESDQPLLRETAGWIVERHPEWAAQVAGVLRTRLVSDKLDDGQLEELERHLIRFAAHGEIQQAMAEVLVDPSAALPRKQLVLNAVSRASMKTLPPVWAAAFQHLLEGADPQSAAAGVATLLTWRQRGTPVQELRPPLLAVAQRADVSDDVRLQALAALEEAGDVGQPLVRFVSSQLAAEKPLEQRLRAADVLAGAQLTREQLQQLLQRCGPLGPMELGRLLPAFARSRDDTVGRQLVDVLQEAPSIGGVPVAILRACFEQFGPEVQQEARRVYAIVDADLESQRAYFDEVFPKLEDGDIRRGQAIFYGSKAACSACHAIGYLGGDIGPDLTRIARIRSPRDMLESILFPNASFVRSYEPVSVITRDGLIYNGVIRQDGVDELTLALAADKFVTIPRLEIEEILPSKTSIMPAGLDKQLSQQELADLLAFLKASK